MLPLATGPAAALASLVTLGVNFATVRLPDRATPVVKASSVLL
jgi:hypothetical protein